MNTVTSIQIQHCSLDAFEVVKQYISIFELDDRELNMSDFLVALENDCVIGFGRIRNYGNYSELCSLGVIESERYKGIATLLVKSLINQSKNSVYAVTVIPYFFQKSGFEICHQYPERLNEKKNYCTTSLPVEETYVVMSVN